MVIIKYLCYGSCAFTAFVLAWAAFDLHNRIEFVHLAPIPILLMWVVMKITKK